MLQKQDLHPSRLSRRLPCMHVVRYKIRALLLPTRSAATDLIVYWIEQQCTRLSIKNEAGTSILWVSGSKFMQRRTMWTTIAKHEFMHKFMFRYCRSHCSLPLPGTQRMLVLASFWEYRCSIQSTMRSVSAAQQTAMLSILLLRNIIIKWHNFYGGFDGFDFERVHSAPMITPRSLNTTHGHAISFPVWSTKPKQ